MKTKRTILAILLVAALMLALFAACSKSGDNTPSNSGSQPSNSGEPTKPSTQEPDDDEEQAELTFWYMFSSNNTEAWEKVEAKLNEITEREINTHVTLRVSEVGTYTSAAGMALSSGEPIDVFVRGFGPLGFGALYASHQILDLQPYMEQYGKGLEEVLGELLDCFRMDGGLWSIPPYRVMNSTAYLGMRKDILEEMGMLEFVENMTSWKEFEQFMDKFIDRYGDQGMYPITLAAIAADGVAFGSDAFEDSLIYDFCGDTTRSICGKEDGTIEALQWNVDQIRQYERFKDWFDRGYVWPDSPYSEVMASDTIKQGVTFCEILASEMGVETTKKAWTGYDYYAKPIANIRLGTDHVNKFGLAVSVNTECPEACVKFMNLMYTDQDVMNLLIFGVEGEHWAMQADGMADYPTPGDASSCAYHGDEFFFGNQFLLVPWAGQGADFRETSLKYFQSASPSRYMGFLLDTTDLSNTIAAISSVNDQYSKAINTGLYTPELLAEYQAKLKDAGIDEYVEAIRAQVAAWEGSR